jgi:hypothetical protein
LWSQSPIRHGRFRGDGVRGCWQARIDDRSCEHRNLTLRQPVSLAQH